MEKKSKVETFIGFSVKARALVYGSDAVNRLKKAYLILLCESAAENTKKLDVFIDTAVFYFYEKH